MFCTRLFGSDLTTMDALVSYNQDKLKQHTARNACVYMEHVVVVFAWRPRGDAVASTTSCTLLRNACRGIPCLRSIHATTAHSQTQFEWVALLEISKYTLDSCRTCFMLFFMASPWPIKRPDRPSWNLWLALC